MPASVDKNFQGRRPRRGRRQRGIALLLVMVAMVVGIMLATGFMEVETSATGLISGESDRANGQALASSGVEIALGIIENNPPNYAQGTPGWLQNAPGTWINNLHLDAGTVSVGVDPITPMPSGSTSFINAPAAGVVIVATATYDGKIYKAQATVTPTGGGNVFQDGLYCNGPVNLSGAAILDAYNGTYSAGSAVAGLVTDGNYRQLLQTSPILTLASGTHFNAVAQMGEPVNSAGSLLGTSGTLAGMLSLGGQSVNVTWAPPAVAGTPVAPPVPAIIVQPPVSLSGSGQALGGIYQSITVPQGANASLDVVGGQVITGGLTIAGTLNVPANTTIVVDGPVNITGAVQMGNGAVLTVYSTQAVTIGTAASGGLLGSGGSGGGGGGLLGLLGNLLNGLFGGGGGGSGGGFSWSGSPAVAAQVNTTGQPQQLMLIGLQNPQNPQSSVTIQGGSIVQAALYAPQSALTLGTSSTDNSQYFGGVVAGGLTIEGNAQLHLDNALQDGASFDNVQNGSWFGDYTVRWH